VADHYLACSLMVQSTITSSQNATAENKPGHKKFANYRLPEWVRHPLKTLPQKSAILFPGEQNHYIGMLKEAKKKVAVQHMLATASDVFGFNVETMMRDGPAATMCLTGYNQPIMYVANCAAYEVLKEDYPEVAENPQAVAGFSVGEFSALYAAGVISYEQGLELVKVRAQALQDLSDDIQMEALTIRGFPLDKVERLVRNAEKQDGSEAALAISRFWCRDGFVCAGKKSTVEKLQQAISKELTKPDDVRLLPDHLHAGHTPLARAAAEQVDAVIDRMIPEMKPPRCELYLNHSGWRVPPNTSPDVIANGLKKQLTTPVYWEGTIVQMMRWGIEDFYECGPNRSIKFMLSYMEYVEEAPIMVKKPAASTINVVV